MDLIINSESNEIQTIKTVLEVLVILIALASLGSIWLQSFVFYKNRLLFKCVVSHFVLNLITVDLLKTLVNVPIFIYSLEVIFNNSTTSLSRDILCNFNAYLITFFDTVQLLSFAAVSFERLRCIKTPLLAIQIRVKLTLRLISAAWLVALISTIILFIAMTIITNYENITNNKCFIDYFHIYALNTANSTDLNYNKYQNIIYDAYNVGITVVGLIIAVYFYSKISIFLEKRRLEMESRYKEKRTTPVGERNTTVVGSTNRPELIEKRKRETKTTKNTIVILSTFITFRLIFLFVIVFRQLINYGQIVNDTISIFYNIELFLIVISYLSCFFNAFIFLYLTDMCKSTAKIYIDKTLVFLRLKSA